MLKIKPSAQKYEDLLLKTQSGPYYVKEFVKDSIRNNKRDILYDKYLCIDAITNTETIVTAKTLLRQKIFKAKTAWEVKEIINYLGRKSLDECNSIDEYVNQWGMRLDEKTGYYKTGPSKDFEAHKFVFVSIYGRISNGYIIDHVTGNRLLYHPKDVRLVTPKQNSINQIKQNHKNRSKLTSLFIGVHFDKGKNKWIAGTSIRNGKKQIIKRCNSEKEAAKAYNDYVIELLNSNDPVINDRFLEHDLPGNVPNRLIVPMNYLGKVEAAKIPNIVTSIRFHNNQMYRPVFNDNLDFKSLILNSKLS